MLVSVVIPTYKRDTEVVRCLESLQAQTQPEYEVILVDNSGDPRIREVVENFNGSRPRRACKAMLHG